MRMIAEAGRMLDRVKLAVPMALLLGASLCFALFAMPGAWLARAMAGTGLATLLPFAAPPLGQGARLLIACLGGIAGGLPVWALFRWLEQSDAPAWMAEAAAPRKRLPAHTFEREPAATTPADIPHARADGQAVDAAAAPLAMPAPAMPDAELPETEPEAAIAEPAAAPTIIASDAAPPAAAATPVPEALYAASETVAPEPRIAAAAPPAMTAAPSTMTAAAAAKRRPARSVAPERRAATPAAAAPPPEARPAEAVIVEAPLGEPPILEAPAVDSPAVDSPAVDSPSPDAPILEVPPIDPHALDAPTFDSPAADMPTIEPQAAQPPAFAAEGPATPPPLAPDAPARVAGPLSITVTQAPAAEDVEPGAAPVVRWWHPSRWLGPRAIPDEAADGVPTLRRSDAHPDAPSRRPIFAASDLGAPLDAVEHDWAPAVAWNAATDDRAAPLVLDMSWRAGTAEAPPADAAPEAASAAALMARLEKALGAAPGRPASPPKAGEALRDAMRELRAASRQR